MASVVGPDGEWTVEIRWVPRDRDESVPARVKRRWGQVINRIADLPADGCLEIMGEGILFTLAFLAGVALLIFVVIPLLVVLVDLLVLLLVAIATFVLRVTFRRPWIVQATSPDRDRWTWRIVGWQAARTLRRKVRIAVESGAFPPAGIEPTTAP